MSVPLGRRWYPLRPHHEQQRLWTSPARFKVVVKGRRSGGSELAKRLLCLGAMDPVQVPGAWYVYGAPTQKQAKLIAWTDLKAMIPKALRYGRPMETELTIRLNNGARLSVVGLDQPYRLEGESLAAFVLDEFDKMKPKVFEDTISPMLSTPGRPPGWGLFVGRPTLGGVNLREVWDRALDPEAVEWDGFHWRSEDVMRPEEIASARSRMDPVSYALNFDASFVAVAGRVYYPFRRSVHAREPLPYDPRNPLLLCFDFNRSPGTASVLQEWHYRGSNPYVPVEETTTAVLDEVWIPNDSVTPLVVREILRRKWKDHAGQVLAYGDVTGGIKGTQSVEGSDWDQIDRMLGRHFSDRYRNMVDPNPREVVRVNSVNTRLWSVDRKVRLLVDPICRNVIRDFESVGWKEGTNEIDKPAGTPYTHLTDGIGYYVHAKFPMSIDGIEPSRWI